MLNVRIIGMELNLNCLPDDAVHIFGFDGGDAVVDASA
jgi:hypothetical protein